MAKGDKLNGSVDTLAKAMRKVFQEAVAGAVEPVRKDMEGMETRINENMGNMEDRLRNQIDDGLKTTNENVQSQLAQHRKDVSDDMKAALSKRS